MTKKKIRRGNGSRAIGDITGSKPAERDLRGLEEQWRSLVENIPDIVMTLDRDGTILFVNRTISGQAVDTVVGASVYDYLPPEHHDTLRQGLERVFERGQAYNFEMGGPGAFGRPSWYFSRIGPIVRDARVVAAALITTDITERKRAEEELRQSEEKLRAQYAGIPVATYTWQRADEDFKLVDYNDAAKLATDARVATLLGKRASEMYQDSPDILDDLARCFDQQTTLKREMLYRLRSTGDHRHLAVSYVFVPPDLIMVHTEDISVRKRAEDALRESEERYRHLVEDINEIIFALDADGRLTYISPVVTEVGGYSASEMVGRPFTDFLHPDDVSSAVEGFQRSISGDHEPVELRFLSKSGELHWLRSFGRPILEGDRVVGLRGVLTDVTERKRAEEALRESEERYRDLAENLNDAIFEFDTSGRMTYVSPGMEEVSAYSASELIGRSVIDLVHPDDLPAVTDRVRRRPFGDREPSEYRLLTKSGEARWVRSLGLPRFEGERVVGFRGVLTDITERKRADEALRESEERWRSLVENAPDIIMTVDADSKILFANRVVSGLAVERVVGTSLYDYLPPEHHDRQRSALERVFETGEPQSYEIAGTGPRGRTSWYFSRIGPVVRDGKVVAAVLTTTDITEQRRAEEALEESEERYRTLVEAAPDVIYSLSTDGTMASLNSAFESISGWSRDEWLGKSFAGLIHPHDLPAAMEDFRLVMQGEVPPTGEYRMLAKSGQYRTVETMPRPLFAGDKVVGTFGIARDITERRQAEEALRESEGRYRDLVERSPDALVVHSEEKILFVNSAAVKLFGAAAPHQIIGRPIWDFIHPESAKAAKKRIQSARRRREEVAVVEEKFVRLDGEVIDVEMAAIPVAYHGKAARQVVLRDITERKRMEDALQHARDELESRVERRMQRGAPYGLTFRELSVLHLLADGKSDKEIGSVLGISTLTAQKHVENIRTKMGASSRTKASVRAVREGLLQQKTPRDSLHTQ